ncbi:MAG: hypothetical protein A2542_00060, partial [Parcubacteria group bacterium RIFOXYD2_FULL_52_8]
MQEGTNNTTHLDSLNDAQRVAATHKDGPLLIIAGAGAGKTKTIAHRILQLVREGVPPEEILAITFTNKAAKEMRERVEKLIQESRDKSQETRLGGEPLPSTSHHLPSAGFPFVSTFHSLGVQLLKENAQLLGTTRYFTILDKNETLALIKRAIKNLGMDQKEEGPGKIQSVISHEKNKLHTLRDFEPRAGESYFYGVVAKVWRAYEEMLATQKAYDFDDLILKPVLLFRSHPQLLERYQDRWRYLHIDEYQDTNVAQYELSRLLADKYKNICVVGDADQSVYGWRGADFRNILDFEKNFAQAKVVLLEENYRSTQIILDTANAVIQKNKLRKPKNLFTKKTGGAKISLYEAFDESDESRHTARELEKLLASGVAATECAVLYRANFQSRALEEALLLRGVPYQVLGTKFYERKEVKDVLCFVRAALNPADTEAWARIVNIPPRGIGAATMEKVLGGREQELPAKTQLKIKEFRQLLASLGAMLIEEKLSEGIRKIIRESGLEKLLSEGNDEEQERLENLKELVTIATKYDLFTPEEALDRFLTDTALMSDQDSLMQKGTGVRLMTIHAAKGLEFKHVFITGLEEGLFPHERLGSTRPPQEEAEEERRLFYVALTRAKEKLHLSYAICRTIFGMRRVNMPSSFLADIDDAVLDF